jgi:hypothetical protein
MVLSSTAAQDLALDKYLVVNIDRNRGVLKTHNEDGGPEEASSSDMHDASYFTDDNL